MWREELGSGVKDSKRVLLTQRQIGNPRSCTLGEKRIADSVQTDALLRDRGGSPHLQGLA